jgi:carbamoyl-phosphate synthase large subunit
MKKNKNILVLEAGGPCGISCIKILKKNSSVNIVAADMSKYAAGFQIADVAIVVPSSSNKTFADAIQKIVFKYKIDLIIPSFEYGYNVLKKINAPFVLDFDSAILCKDKLKFMEFCQKHHLPSPKTKLLKLENGWGFPAYIKPRNGAGSRDNYVANNESELKGLCSYLKEYQNFIIQDFLRGDHWNVDILVDQGKFISAVPRKDLVQKAGNCITVEVRNYEQLINFSKLVQETVNIKSPFNLEVFETSPGNFVINEINVRFGGGIIFSAMAGVDMVSYLVNKDKSNIGTIKEGIYTRYYEETFVDLGKNIII